MSNEYCKNRLRYSREQALQMLGYEGEGTSILPLPTIYNQGKLQFPYYVHYHMLACHEKMTDGYTNDQEVDSIRTERIRLHQLQIDHYTGRDDVNNSSFELRQALQA